MYIKLITDIFNTMADDRIASGEEFLIKKGQI